jgi:hypothetical protein
VKSDGLGIAILIAAGAVARRLSLPSSVCSMVLAHSPAIRLYMESLLNKTDSDLELVCFTPFPKSVVSALCPTNTS